MAITLLRTQGECRTKENSIFKGITVHGNHGAQYNHFRGNPQCKVDVRPKKTRFFDELQHMEFSGPMQPLQKESTVQGERVIKDKSFPRGITFSGSLGSQCSRCRGLICIMLLQVLYQKIIKSGVKLSGKANAEILLIFIGKIAPVVEIAAVLLTMAETLQGLSPTPSISASLWVTQQAGVGHSVNGLW
ncbi:hypothetical protein J6590_042655 [Homalodisca vitripennis]|nr:hypothetical protein J6590_042655 [Homalodisca vitripennis]